MNAPLEIDSPFQKLAYFIEDDHERFGGRDNEINDIIARVSSREMLVLYGASGVGKTSLLRAGVFPRARERGWKPIYFRTLRNPVDEISVAIRKELPEPAIEPLPDGTDETRRASKFDPNSERDRAVDHTAKQLVRILSANSQKGAILLVFDQFEELFIRFEDSPREVLYFTRLIDEIVSSKNVNCRIIFSLREEHIHRLDELAGIFREPLSNRYRVSGLTPSGARDAVRKMLSKSSIDADSGFMSKLVDDITKKLADPVLLQVHCFEALEVAKRRWQPDEDRVLTAEHLMEAGTSDQIFQRYLTAAFQRMRGSLNLVARMVIETMITESDTKQAMTLDDFKGGTTWRFADFNEVEQVLSILEQESLVRSDERDEGGKRKTWFELYHERLIRYLKAALRLDLDFLRLYAVREQIRGMSTIEVAGEFPILLAANALQNTVTTHHEYLVLDVTALRYILVSAINCGGSQYSFWATQLDAKRGAESSSSEPLALDVLTALLASNNSELRAGAARTVGWLTLPSADLLRRCAKLALCDPEDSVRKAAFTSIFRPSTVEAAKETQAAGDADSLGGLRGGKLRAEVLAFSGAKQYSVWVKRLGEREALGILAELLASSDADFRLCAALTVGWLTPPSADLLRRCVALASDDPVEPVREGALRSLLRPNAFRIAKEEGLLERPELLISWARRKHEATQDLLLKLRLAHALPATLSLWQRAQLWWATFGIWKTRRSASYAAQWKRGAARGAFFGLLWCGTVGLPVLMASLLLFVQAPRNLGATAMAVLAALLLGGLLGGFFARQRLKQILMRRRTALFRSVLNNLVYILVLVGLALGIGVAWNMSSWNSEPLRMFIIYFGFWSIIPFGAQLTDSCLGTDQRGWRALAWVWSTTLIWPLTVVATIAGVSEIWSRDALLATEYEAIAIAATMSSFVCYVVSMCNLDICGRLRRDSAINGG